MKPFCQTLILAALLCISFSASAQDKTLQVLCIGNSYTYFHDSNLRLEEIAASQGHQLKTKACTVGGYTLHRHLKNDDTMSSICYNRYDVVFLQEQSQTPAIYGQNPKRGRLIERDLKEIADRVRIYSPQSRVWFEHTWSFRSGNFGGFGSMHQFDLMLQKGATKLAKKAHVGLSPIGEAFAIVRSERPDIELYDPDQKHQSALGTYLKSCVNYLLIYGEAFHGEVSSCGNDSASCAFLRSVAERVVLNGEKGIKK